MLKYSAVIQRRGWVYLHNICLCSLSIGGRVEDERERERKVFPLGLQGVPREESGDEIKFTG